MDMNSVDQSLVKMTIESKNWAVQVSDGDASGLFFALIYDYIFSTKILFLICVPLILVTFVSHMFGERKGRLRLKL